MRIQIKKLSLLNFKGIRTLEINFSHVTNIYGDNATGKTTIFDAFLWLLFGKDSTDRKDFEIKTLDSNNQPLHRMDHEVIGVLEVDSEEIILKRIFKEKWVKKRGDNESIFSGHETGYYWNDVPLKQEEFQAKVSGILNENIFKLITNTSYFNSLKWQDRRDVLMQLGGNISNEDIFDKLITTTNKGHYTGLINALNAKKSLDEYKREVSAKKKKIKDELELIPARIDEASRSLPEEKDYASIEKQIGELMTSLENVDSLLMNKNKAEKERQQQVNNLLQDRQELSRQLLEIEFNIKNSVKDHAQARQQVILNEKREFQRLTDELTRLTGSIGTEERKKTQIEREQVDLRNRWQEINKEELHFNEGQFACPTCKREYEASKVDEKKKELANNFNLDKSKRLSDISTQGKKLANDIAVLDKNIFHLKSEKTNTQNLIADIVSKINTLNEEHARLSSDEDQEVLNLIKEHSLYQEIKGRISQINETVTTSTDDGNSELLEQKRNLVSQIDGYKKEISTKEQREKILSRISELGKQEKELAQELASLESNEYCIEQFTKAKMDTLESRINGRFQLVKFKLFAEQINGGQIECCETLINGVPYTDANTASKISAGIDIINTLCDHYGVTAPIFIDNRESVVKIPESHSQIINLIVSSKDKRLRIGSVKAEFQQDIFKNEPVI